MQSETGFPSSHQLKSYVASKSRLKLAARAVLSADAGLLVGFPKAQWPQYTGEVGNVQANDVKFSQELTHQKSSKSVNF